jgi:hypothetical protein
MYARKKSSILDGKGSIPSEQVGNISHTIMDSLNEKDIS